MAPDGSISVLMVRFPSTTASWKPHPEPSRPLEARGLLPAWCVTVGLALITVLIGLFPDTLAAYCLAAAAEIGGAR